MTVSSELLGVIEHACSSAEVLAGAVRVVAQRLHAGACWAFLLDNQGNVTQTAVFGDEATVSRDRVEAAAVAARALTERRSLVHNEQEASWLVSPMMLRDRVVGALVLQDTERSYSVDDIATLATACAQLVGVVENSRIVEALTHGQRPPVGAPKARKSRGTGERVLQGVAASPGVACGVVMFRGALAKPRDAPVRGSLAQERARVRSAVSKAASDLRRIQSEAAREIDEEHALIFASHLLLLNDPTLLDHVDRQMTEGASASLAIVAAFDDFERQLRAIEDPYIREKIDDIDDLRARLLDNLAGGPRDSLAKQIVVSRTIPPSLVVELKTEGALALVTEVGGTNSHGVLLARAMNIPVVTGVVEELDDLGPDDRLAVDGSTGVVVVRPSPATLELYAAERLRLARARADYARYRDVLCVTADGVRIPLYANVGVASDLSAARENGAESIGLYRTEFPFMVRETFPTRQEQVRIYARAYELFPDGPIHFRILDLGGDKFVTGESLKAARSPFHGYRSIRVLFDHPEVLRDQVQALGLAAGERPLFILVPMVSSLDDLRRVREMIAEALLAISPSSRRSVQIGVMIEVPAAVELARELAREADFLSIGTNDLAQYTLVVDREDSRMARSNDPYHPALLRMIARVGAAAREAGKPLSVCGEIAARPDLALAMVALGVDALSVAPNVLPELKKTLSGMRLDRMRQAMPAILRLGSSAEVGAALKLACAA